MKGFRKILMWLMMMGLSCSAFGQENIIFSGHVLEEGTNSPVANHEVFVNTNDSLIFNLYITDENGFFQDSIFIGGININSLNFLTFDCQGFPVDTAVYTFNQAISVEFHICRDTLTNSCDAVFDYFSNPANPFEISFLNLSTGNFTEQQWEFGDSTYSTEFNPVHTYQAPGDYPVCLTVSNNDSANACYSTFCLLVHIGMVNPCHANFTYELDSMSPDPNIFRFYDQSTGDIDSWFWDFGDGTFSFEQDPVHLFIESNEVLVCLTVSSSVNPNLGQDITCEELTMGNYFNFGGLVWEGDYPLNNPVFNNDSGIVFLYRLHEGKLRYMDSNLFWENGYYWFTNKLEGQYIIKVALTHGSANYNNFLPTYFGNKSSWESAELLDLDQDIFNKHINLLAVMPLEPGPGSISGQLTYEGNIQPGLEQQVNITLSDQDNQALIFTEPTTGGSFQFDGLPLGTYIVSADLAGRPSDPQTVTISSYDPLATGIEIHIYEEVYFSIDENEPDALIISNVYPNPARDRLNMDLEIVRRGNVVCSVTDIMGKILFSSEQFMDQGKETFSMDVSSLSHGVYILDIRSRNGGPAVVRKFVK